LFVTSSSILIEKVAVGMAGAGRSIGVAVDFSSCSKNALRWAAANLAAAGDRLILIHVKSSYQYEEGVAHLWERDGSRTHMHSSLPAILRRWFSMPEY
jgi:nucleotide-binding universal stress UspA family protein